MMEDEFIFDYCDEAFQDIKVSVSTDFSASREVKMKSVV